MVSSPGVKKQKPSPALSATFCSTFFRAIACACSIPRCGGDAPPHQKEYTI